MSATEEEKKMVKKIENKILPTRDKYASFLYLDSSMYKLTLIFHQQTATSWHAKTGIFILLLLYFCLFFQNKFSCFEIFWLHLPNYLGNPYNYCGEATLLITRLPTYKSEK